VLEDKLLQLGVAQILSAIYEADFLPCSYGYRPKRSAHDAVRELTETLAKGKYEFVVEADIKGFFNHIDHEWLLRMLRERIDDGALLGLIEKWLKAGVMEEDGGVDWPEEGTPQGGSISPILANVYLHYALDLWFEKVVRKTCQGECRIYRYADDFVCAFERRHEAEKFHDELGARLKKFRLEVAPDKTQMLRFGWGGGKYNGRFEFLGFEFRWEPSLKGKPIVKRRTSRKKLRGAVANFKEWIQKNRDSKLPQLMSTLRKKLTGYWNYYGVRGNSESLGEYRKQTRRLLYKWLNRRSQKRSFTWSTFNRMIERFQIPEPNIWEKTTEARVPTLAWTKGQLQQAQSVNLFGKHYRSGHA
jgi:RNA-directed DNA polymerase